MNSQYIVFLIVISNFSLFMRHFADGGAKDCSNFPVGQLLIIVSIF